MTATSEDESAEQTEESGGATGADAAPVTDAEPTRTTTHRPGDDVVHPDAAKRTFDWKGDVLLAVLFFALVVAPVVVYLRPPALSWRVRFLLFPLLPAILLGAVAVWATTRP